MKTHHKKEARGVGDTADNFSEYALAQAEAMLSSLAKGYLAKVKSETESWKMVLRAKELGEDIHSAPNKTHKLDITGGEHHDFGQHIVNETKTKSEVK